MYERLSEPSFRTPRMKFVKMHIGARPYLTNFPSFGCPLNVQPRTPLATRNRPLQRKGSPAPANTKTPPDSARCIQPRLGPRSGPTGYAWPVTGRQASSSSIRSRKAARASRPRATAPVGSPQCAQHRRAASQSGRFVSSPQLRQCTIVSMIPPFFLHPEGRGRTLSVL